MTVFSRAHLMQENVPARRQDNLDGHAFLDDLRTWPSFVIQADAFELLKRADCVAAIQALVDADIFKMPHPKMAIEFCVRNGLYAAEMARVGGDVRESEVQPMHEFVLMEEIPGGFKMRYGFLYVRDRIGGIGEFSVSARPHKNLSRQELDAVIDAPHWQKGHTYDPAKPGGFLLEFSEPDIHPTVREAAVEALMMAVNIVFVLMNIKGIEREEHTCEPLNKARIKKGKPRISEYTYLRIGHVYKADGTRVKYTDGDIRTRPMHVRSAHTRRQHFGKNNEETKIIYVPSVIVNFNPHDELKKPKQKIIKA